MREDSKADNGKLQASDDDNGLSALPNPSEC